MGMYMGKYDIHDRKRRLETMIKSTVNDKDVTPKNKKRIFEFDQYAVSIGLKEARRFKYMRLLRWLSKVLGKPFEKATREDMKRIMVGVQRSPLAEWSKTDRKVTIKRFYKWLKGDDEEYPKEVRWIKTTIKHERVMLPEELITDEDVKKMADTSVNTRDKAIVQCLYESGCRIGELITLQIKNISFDEYGAVLRVTGKTGSRRIRIVASAPALATWMDCHPYKSDPEAYVFVRHMNKRANDPLPFRYAIARKIIKDLAIKAGVKKRVNPHTFRHSRATALASKLTEAQMKAYFGWTQSSRMAGVYVHMSGRDVDGAILGMYGMKDQENEKKEDFKPVNCPRCSNNNSPASKFCIKCGYALSAEVAIKMEEEGNKAHKLLDTLMKDPEFKELIFKKMMEKGVESFV